MQAIWFPPELPTHYPVALGGGQIPSWKRYPLDAIPKVASSFTDGADMVDIIRHGPMPPLARRLECNTVPPPPPLQTLDGSIPPMPARPPPRP